MTGWVALIGSFLATAGLVVRWYMSEEQREKRRKRYANKEQKRRLELEVRLRHALDSGDMDVIRDIHYELGLLTSDDSEDSRPEPSDSGSKAK